MKNEEWKKKCIFAGKVGVEARLVLQRRIKQKIGVPFPKSLFRWNGLVLPGCSSEAAKPLSEVSVSPLLQSCGID